MILLAGICGAGIGPANAAVDLSAGAAISYEHDSNPTELSDSQAQDFLARGFIAQKDDTLKRLSANVGAITGKNQPTQVQLQAQFTKVDNDYFDDLDHTEYDVNGLLDWKPSQVFDVSLEVSQGRAPLQQNDVGGDQTVQETTRGGAGTLRLRPMPRWQLSLVPTWFKKDIPLPGTEGFELVETSGSALLDYLGTGPLIPGLVFRQSKGKYSGIGNSNRYTQQVIGGSLNYKITDFSTFSLWLGNARRTTRLDNPTNDPLAFAQDGTTNAFTGTFTFQRQLSVKTSIEVEAFREFQQYEFGGNTTLASGITAGVIWNPTSKISTSLGTQFAWSTIEGVQATATTGFRKDLVRSYLLDVKYLATKHITLRPYITMRTRDSTLRSAVFDRTLVGLELSAAID